MTRSKTKAQKGLRERVMEELAREEYEACLADCRQLVRRIDEALVAREAEGSAETSWELRARMIAEHFERLTSERDEYRAHLEALAGEFESVVRAADPPKGMQVPYFGPWASVRVPSAVLEFRRHAKAIRKLLEGRND